MHKQILLRSSATAAAHSITENKLNSPSLLCANIIYTYTLLRELYRYIFSIIIKLRRALRQQTKVEFYLNSR
jgi:hypothetical protein